MRLLVSGCTATVRALAPRWPGRLGQLLRPGNGNRPGALPWAADNAAFTGFDPARFRAFLRRLAGAPGCLFLAVPDHVGNALGTLWSFWLWREECAATGLPLAFVGQDCAEQIELPWDYFDAYFIGGTTRWKLSRASADLAREARRRGKHVHMGRVNSYVRLAAAFDFGCDSVDGTATSRYGDRYIRAFCARCEHLTRQQVLFPPTTGAHSRKEDAASQPAPAPAWAVGEA